MGEPMGQFVSIRATDRFRGEKETLHSQRHKRLRLLPNKGVTKHRTTLSNNEQLRHWSLQRKKYFEMANWRLGLFLTVVIAVGLSNSAFVEIDQKLKPSLGEKLGLMKVAAKRAKQYTDQGGFQRTTIGRQEFFELLEEKKAREDLAEEKEEGIFPGGTTPPAWTPPPLA